MSHNLVHALKHFWLWRKNNVFGSFAFSFACSVLLHFSPIKHEILYMLLAGIPFFYVLMGLAKDVFSWKYYQSLPLNKKDLYHYHLLIQYPIYLPMLLWYFCFPDYVNDLFFEHNQFSWRLSAVVSAIYVFGTLLIGIGSFRNTYEMVRKPYVKFDQKQAFLQFLRNAIYWIAGVIILAGSVLLMTELFPESADYFKWVGIVGGISFVPAMFIAFYFYTFKRWNREELSYFKNNFKVARDVPLMALGSLLIWSTFNATSSGISVSGMYGKKGKEGIFKAIQTYRMEDLHRLKNDPKQLMSVTEKGWTPLMVAAHQGNSAAFRALWDAGASREGKVNDEKDKVHHNMDLFMLSVDGKNFAGVSLLASPENVNMMIGGRTPLHIAAFNCHPEMVDLLIEKGANPNALNEGGSTALHVAARMNCFGAAVSLIEAGADPNIKNKKSQIAHNLLPKDKRDNRQFSYYLGKKGRLPAGK